jgi:hypothetical protein
MCKRTPEEVPRQSSAAGELLEFPCCPVAVVQHETGTRHLADENRTQNQNVAMISDILVSLVLLAYVGSVFGIQQAVSVIRMH